MRLLRMHSATIKRQDDGGNGWNDTGDWELITDRLETTINCCVQPDFSGSQFQKTLPTGIYQKDCRIIYTPFVLRTADEYGQNNADYVVFEDIEYEVFENDPWDSLSNRLTHHKALMIRRDKIDADTPPTESTVGGVSWL